jgi:hypothetical protein
MHPQKIVLILLAIPGMFASFLPWIIMQGVTPVNGTSGAGWITFAVFAIILTIIFSGRFRDRISGFSIICISILALLNGLYGLILINEIEGNESAAEKSLAASPGIGIYLIIICGFLIVLAGLFMRGRKVVTPVKEGPEITMTVTETKNPS